MLKSEGRWAAKIEELLTASYARQALTDDAERLIALERARSQGATFVCAGCDVETLRLTTRMKFCSAKCRYKFNNPPKRGVGRPRKSLAQ